MTGIEAIPTMTATLSRTGRKARGHRGRKTEEGCSQEMENQIQRDRLATDHSHYWSLWTSRVVVVIPISVMASVVREGTKASFW